MIRLQIELSETAYTISQSCPGEPEVLPTIVCGAFVSLLLLTAANAVTIIVL